MNTLSPQEQQIMCIKPAWKERAIRLGNCYSHLLKPLQNKQRKTPCICFEIMLSDLGS